MKIFKLLLIAIALNFPAFSTTYPLNPFKHRKFFASYPMISGEVFRNLCHHRSDEGPIDINKIKEGDLVFLRGKYFKKFISEMHLIKNKFIIISHLTPNTQPSSSLRFLSNKNLVAWFGKNMNLNKHEKLYQIPIGFYQGTNPPKGIAKFNLYEPFRVSLQKLLENPQIKNIKKNYLLSQIFTFRYEKTHRKKVAEYFKNKSYCTKFRFLDFESYCDVLQNSYFTLSPRGSGIDCFRTWEAMLLGSIPIVLSSFLDPMYQDLPVLIINDWNQINEKFLYDQLDLIRKKSINYEKLYADYWIKEIIKVREKFIPNAEKPLFIGSDNPYIKLKIKDTSNLNICEPFSIAELRQWLINDGGFNYYTEDPELALILARCIPTYGHVIIPSSCLQIIGIEEFLSLVMKKGLAQQIIIDEKDQILIRQKPKKITRNEIQNCLDSLNK